MLLPFVPGRVGKASLPASIFNPNPLSWYKFLIERTCEFTFVLPSPPAKNPTRLE
jgi:hypothetical protein